MYVCSSTCTVIRIRDSDYGLTCYLNRDLEPNHAKSQLHQKKINETKYKQTEIEEDFFYNLIYSSESCMKVECIFYLPSKN